MGFTDPTPCAWIEGPATHLGRIMKSLKPEAEISGKTVFFGCWGRLFFLGPLRRGSSVGLTFPYGGRFDLTAMLGMHATHNHSTTRGRVTISGQIYRWLALPSCGYLWTRVTKYFPPWAADPVCSSRKHRGQELSDPAEDEDFAELAVAVSTARKMLSHMWAPFRADVNSSGRR